MKKWLKKNFAVVNATANLVVIFGLVLAGIGAFGYFNHKAPVALASNSKIQAVLPERQVAIDQAIKNGQQKYSFVTHFLPGIGYISDLAAYQKTVEQQLQQAVDAESQK